MGFYWVFYIGHSILLFFTEIAVDRIRLKRAENIQKTGDRFVALDIDIENKM